MYLFKKDERETAPRRETSASVLIFRLCCLQPLWEMKTNYITLLTCPPSFLRNCRSAWHWSWVMRKPLAGGDVTHLRYEGLQKPFVSTSKYASTYGSLGVEMNLWLNDIVMFFLCYSVSIENRAAYILNNLFKKLQTKIWLIWTKNKDHSNFSPSFQ